MTPDNTDGRKIYHGRSTSRFCFRPDGIVRLERLVNTRKPIEEIDAIGPMWSVAVGHIHPRTLQLRVGETLHSISGPSAIFIQPFSIMRWVIRPGQLKFVAYNSAQAFFPFKAGAADVVIKKISSVPESPDREDFMRLLNENGPQEEISLTPNHVIIANAKRMIDQNYRSNIHISEIASKLKFNHAVLTRYFSNYFGISPIAYRNRLRVFETHFRLMLREHETISNLGIDAGFESMSQFSREFKKVTGVPPGTFQKFVLKQ